MHSGFVNTKCFKSKIFMSLLVVKMHSGFAIAHKVFYEKYTFFNVSKYQIVMCYFQANMHSGLQ